MSPTLPGGLSGRDASATTGAAGSIGTEAAWVARAGFDRGKRRALLRAFCDESALRRHPCPPAMFADGGLRLESAHEQAQGPSALDEEGEEEEEQQQQQGQVPEARSADACEGAVGRIGEGSGALSHELAPDGGGAGAWSYAPSDMGDARATAATDGEPGMGKGGGGMAARRRRPPPPRRQGAGRREYMARRTTRRSRQACNEFL